MKTVLFLVHNDKITIRRFLLVADRLQRSDIKPCFLNLSRNYKAIEEIAKEMQPNFKYNIYQYENFRAAYKTGLLCTKIKRYLLLKAWPDREDKAVAISRKSDTIGFEELLNKLNFNTEAVIKQCYESDIAWWEFNIKLAKDRIRKIKPDCIVYDLEMYVQVRSFLLAAKEEKVPIVSMQHGEGFSHQYSNLPSLADYYIAYSPYNVEKIKALGVEDKNIFLTGIPDTDYIYDYDISKIKEELRCKYGISFDKKIILVALRTANLDSLEDVNSELMEAVAGAFGNDDKFQIVIKPHNVDYMSGIPFSCKNFVRCKNFKIIDSDYPFSKLLKISHYLITHLSCCVVEAAVVNVPTIVVEFPDGGIWPDWNNYKIFNNIPASRLGQTLTEIKNDKYVFKFQEDSRQKFIQRFRFRYDNKSAERIAKALEGIIL